MWLFINIIAFLSMEDHVHQPQNTTFSPSQLKERELHKAPAIMWSKFSTSKQAAIDMSQVFFGGWNSQSVLTCC